MTEWWYAYLGLGAAIGFFAGLLGIGGGTAMVPVLAFIFAAKGFPAEYVLHMGLATCMASILFTSASSVISHHRHGAVNWSILRSMVPGILAGTLGGALLVGAINTRLLSVLFTAFVYFAATRMLLSGKPEPARSLPGTRAMSVAGAVIGALSSLAAIAGAVFTVPFLVKHNVRMHEAIGTAAAVGWPLALAGTVGFVASGLGRAGLPEHTIGFVYLPALVFIVIGSVATAPLGARVAHRTRGTMLKIIFAIFLYLLATRMLFSFF
ncbi:MAG: sulfite exporter TauE/SafE family protein [Betaproteobacteria bacterium]|nr:sulfite exporter TauE/SafE family protein [Betaproteobacteria bacterium]MBI3937935.1 sulfite exporter TauE/SafE family protein [Betaproteobacteria bacterium]